ncbi:MAG: Flp pilus assembly complex ATPase component TadA [Actinobacteria bacterium]|nr:Flp pilus assembly complex ATPase component TadA [Actinomycetota bacterium]
MGPRLGAGLGAAMGLTDRVSRAIALGETPLSAPEVRAEARRLLAAESPWKLAEGVESVVGAVMGFGPIQALFDDPEVTDILVNGPFEVWQDRGQGLEIADVIFQSDEHLVATVERAIAPLGLRIDRLAPMVDARLPDGSRLHAVLPPAAVGHPLVAVRRFSQRITSLDDLVLAGSATEEQVDELRAAVAGAQTVVVSGGTGTGKTTLLNLLGGLIPREERVVTIEDAAELSLPGHVVRLEARPPNSEGVGAITIRELVRSALRLRPDRLIVGEVRGAEALDLVSALNTGHRGSMTTVHANSPEEAMWRLETLALSAGDTSEAAVGRQLHAAIDLVCQIERVGPVRRLVSIAPVSRLDLRS